MSYFDELKRRNVLRVAAAYIVVSWVIIEAVVTLRELFPETPIWLGQALTVLLVIGIVPVLVFSWLYELTPEGFKRESDVGDDRSYSDALGRKLIYITMAGVFLGLALFGWSRIQVAPETMRDATVEIDEQVAVQNSVAVLPFLNLSGNSDNAYFSDGLTETLLHMLAQVPGLKVPARTSVFAVDRNADIRTIADALGVRHVLEGSVQRVGDTVRITSQLIRAEDGFQVWSENYDRKLNDIFAIQDEIAEQVGIKLLASMRNPVDIHGVGTKDFEAYDLYLRAQTEKHVGTSEALQKARRHLRDAIAIDAGFNDAKMLLAHVVIEQADAGFKKISDAVSEADSLINEILADNPSHAEARVMRLFIDLKQAFQGGDYAMWRQIEPQLRAVLANSPHDIEARVQFSILLSSLGNRVEAVSILEESVDLDPLNPELLWWLGNVREQSGQFEDARRAYERALEIQPESVYIWETLGYLGYTVGDGRLAIESLLQATSLDPADHELPMSVANLLYSIGLPNEAQPYHDRVAALAPDSEATKLLDMQQALAVGDLDQAVSTAREVVVAFPPERLYAWRRAWRILSFTSVARGTEEEILALYAEYLPHFLDLEQVEINGMINTVRINSLDVLRAVKTDKELLDYSDKLAAHFAQLGFGSRDTPALELDLYILKNEIENGIRWALEEVFSRPFTTVELWRLRFGRTYLAPIMNDPRLQRELARWDRQQARMREEILDYLAERSKD